MLKRFLLDKINGTKNALFPADFVTFTEEILNGKLHFCAMLQTTFITVLPALDCYVE